MKLSTFSKSSQSETLFILKEKIMTSRALVMVVLIGLSGCVSISGSEPVRLSATDIFRVEEVVKTKLRDPGSAQFSKVSAQKRVFSDGRTDTVICGLVNSKNGFGGYAGATAFSVFRDKAGKLSLGAIDESNQLGLALDGHCQTFSLL
jgi:hypothetical protein